MKRCLSTLRPKPDLDLHTNIGILVVLNIMPKTEVFFYQEEDGAIPVLEWLNAVRQRDRKAYIDCVERIERLKAFGYELRRPHADYLRNGIYELRARHGNVNFRILYFFHGQNVAIAAHALTKEKKIPEADIERAIQRKIALEQNPEAHIYAEE